MSRPSAVPSFACASVGSRGAHRVTQLFKQSAEACGSGGLASFFGAPVCNRSGRKVSLFSEQSAELQCPESITTLVSATVRRFRPRKVIPLFE